MSTAQLAGERAPGGFRVEAAPAAFLGRRGRRVLIDPAAAAVAIDDGAGQVADPAQVRRGGDRGGVARQYRIAVHLHCPAARSRAGGWRWRWRVPRHRKGCCPAVRACRAVAVTSKPESRCRFGYRRAAIAEAEDQQPCRRHRHRIAAPPASGEDCPPCAGRLTLVGVTGPTAVASKVRCHASRTEAT